MRTTTTTMTRRESFCSGSFYQWRRRRWQWSRPLIFFDKQRSLLLDDTSTRTDSRNRNILAIRRWRGRRRRGGTNQYQTTYLHLHLQEKGRRPILNTVFIIIESPLQWNPKKELLIPHLVLKHNFLFFIFILLFFLWQKGAAGFYVYVPLFTFIDVCCMVVLGSDSVGCNWCVISYTFFR